MSSAFRVPFEDFVGLFSFFNVTLVIGDHALHPNSNMGNTQKPYNLKAIVMPPITFTQLS